MNSNEPPQIIERDYSNVTLQLISKLLTQNPEYYTIWNHRRLVLQHVFATERQRGEAPSHDVEDDMDSQAAHKAGMTLAQQEISLLIKEDLQFLLPLLKQHPKCYWIWNHRSWLLKTASTHLPKHASLELWNCELALVGKMLAIDSRNFHGWDYRRAVVSEIETLSASSMVESEYEYTTKMTHSNLSNFSAWHNRSRLIPHLLAHRSAGAEERRALLDAELDLVTRALYTDPYDQSLWFYHQYLMSTLDASNSQATSILDPCTHEDRRVYLERELDSIRDMLDGAEDCKYIYQALLEHSKQYVDVGGDPRKVSMQDLKQWLLTLRKIDPLREGRWHDLESKMMG